MISLNIKVAHNFGKSSSKCTLAHYDSCIQINSVKTQWDLEIPYRTNYFLRSKMNSIFQFAFFLYLFIDFWFKDIFLTWQTNFLRTLFRVFTVYIYVCLEIHGGEKKCINCVMNTCISFSPDEIFGPDSRCFHTTADYTCSRCENAPEKEKSTKHSCAIMFTFQ